VQWNGIELRVLDVEGRGVKECAVQLIDAAVDPNVLGENVRTPPTSSSTG
jgi:hypothetical protein